MSDPVPRAATRRVLSPPDAPRPARGRTPNTTVTEQRTAFTSASATSASATGASTGRLPRPERAERAEHAERGERGDDRRQALIDAARALIAERGFEGLRTRDVAERVGINHATIHHYFPTKEALIEAVVRDLVARLDTVRLIPEYGALAPREALGRHLRVACEQMVAEPALFVALDEFFLRAGRDPALSPVLNAVNDGWTGYLTGLFQRGRAAGAFRPDLEPQAAAAVVVGFFKGVALPVPDGGRALQDAIAQLERWIAGPDDALLGVGSSGTVAVDAAASEPAARRGDRRGGRA